VKDDGHSCAGGARIAVVSLTEKSKSRVIEYIAGLLEVAVFAADHGAKKGRKVIGGKIGLDHLYRLDRTVVLAQHIDGRTNRRN
jgi:hypothetical protein